MTVDRRSYPETWEDYPIAMATIRWAPRMLLAGQEVDVYCTRENRIVWRSIGMVMALRCWQEDWVLFPSRLGDDLVVYLPEEVSHADG